MAPFIPSLEGTVNGKGTVQDTLLDSSSEGNLINEKTCHHAGKQVPTPRIRGAEVFIEDQRAIPIMTKSNRMLVP